MTRIAFCGVGALGSGAVLLCRNLDATLRLIDGDRVESRNLLAQGFVKQSLGKNKADAMKLQLLNFYGIRAESFAVRVTEQNVEALLGPADLVVDCFDNAASRRVLSEFAEAQRRPLVHAALAADGTFGIVRWEARFTADEEDEPGQATCEGGEHLPLYGLAAAALARCIQQFLKNGGQEDYIVSLNGVRQV